ncbi:MAG: phosphotransferase enzyme family protein, partial [Candidatus Fimenecus sp.]
METAMFDIEFLQSNFKLQGTYQSYKTLNDGHINSTFVLDYAEEDGTAHSYVVQKINTNIFTDPDALMGNIVGVTSFLQKKIAARGGDVQRETLNFLPGADGKYYAKDASGSCWRCYRHIGNVYTCNIIDSEEVFYNAGTAFGAFQQALADYPSETLAETIPNFHNTYSRFLDFKKAVADNLSGRRDNVQDEIQFILDREADTHILLDLIDKGELPLRVTHNDTKLNNILFDDKT